MEKDYPNYPETDEYGHALDEQDLLEETKDKYHENEALRLLFEAGVLSYDPACQIDFNNDLTDDILVQLGYKEA